MTVYQQNLKAGIKALPESRSNFSHFTEHNIEKAIIFLTTKDKYMREKI